MNTDPTLLQLVLLAIVAALALWAVYRFQRRARPDPTPTHETLRTQQLQDARLHLLEHRALAEYHSAMATMLAARITRLETQP